MLFESPYGLPEGVTLNRLGIALSASALSVVLLAACTGPPKSGVVTVTSTFPASVSSEATSGSPTGATQPSPVASTAPSSGALTTTAETAATGTASAPPPQFVPTKLAPGEKAPQFIVVSFDGVGWHEKWQYYNDIATKVPLRFTGFLTGLYLLSDTTKDNYQGPGHKRGRSSLGAWNTQDELVQEIADLNAAYQQGNEIGTHFNGHFCSDNPPGSGDWSTADWNDELDQFFGFMKNVQSNNDLPSSTTLAFGPDDIKGARTPCLEANPGQLFPALKAHGLTYDSSLTRRGISWPTLSEPDGLWQMGMAEFPVHGTDHFQITMDYNFYYTQRNASSEGVTAEQSAADAAQVQATYQDMYAATVAGNRAPLILGNHFNAWNNNAYTEALGGFLLANCAKPDTYCVPYVDVIDWMELQDPSVLAALQSQPAEMGPPAA